MFLSSDNDELCDEFCVWFVFFSMSWLQTIHQKKTNDDDIEISISMNYLRLYLRLWNYVNYENDDESFFSHHQNLMCDERSFNFRDSRSFKILKFTVIWIKAVFLFINVAFHTIHRRYDRCRSVNFRLHSVFTKSFSTTLVFNVDFRSRIFWWRRSDRKRILQLLIFWYEALS